MSLSAVYVLKSRLKIDFYKLKAGLSPVCLSTLNSSGLEIFLLP